MLLDLILVYFRSSNNNRRDCSQGRRGLTSVNQTCYSVYVAQLTGTILPNATCEQVKHLHFTRLTYSRSSLLKPENKFVDNLANLLLSTALEHKERKSSSM